jgi:DNA repair protein RadC
MHERTSAMQESHDLQPLHLPHRNRTIKLRCIKAVYEQLHIKEQDNQYLPPFTRYTSPEQVADTFSFLKQETKEYFFSIHLDGKNRISCVDEVSVGSLNQSIVHPREVFKTALLSSAAAIILVHNHPTGDSNPSREDIEITRRLKEAGDIIGVKLLDHIIIGDGYLSFTERGLL